MKIRRLGLPYPLLAAPVLLAFAARGEVVAFQPRSGASVTKTYATTTNVTLENMTMSQNGQEIDDSAMGDMEQSIDTSANYSFGDEYIAVEGGQTRKLKRTFEELGNSTSTSASGPMGDQDSEITGSSKLEGLSVVFQWDGDASDYGVSFAEGSGGDKELLEGLREDVDLRRFLPGKEVAVGDSWELPLDAMQDLFAPGGAVKIEPEETEGGPSMGGSMPSIDQILGDFEGEAIATFSGLREEAGAKVAVLHLKLDVKTANDVTDVFEEMMAEGGPEGMEIDVESMDMAFSFDGEGDLLWNLEEGMFLSIELSGEVSMDVDTAMNFGGMSIEMSMSFGGTQTMSLSCSH